jgi:hypothetical protein
MGQIEEYLEYIFLTNSSNHMRKQKSMILTKMWEPSNTDPNLHLPSLTIFFAIPNQLNDMKMHIIMVMLIAKINKNESPPSFNLIT